MGVAPITLSPLRCQALAAERAVAANGPAIRTLRLVGAEDGFIAGGFARRLATYKRLNLLLQDVERALRVVAGDRPIQVLLAGKAHPRDDGGKRLVQGLFAMKNAPGFANRVAYLDDYDLRMAAELVRGCDVWINLPRPPLEASGTSGMKAAMNRSTTLT